MGAIGNEVQLTRHGSGLTKATCTQFEVIYNRYILPLCRWVVGGGRPKAYLLMFKVKVV